MKHTTKQPHQFTQRLFNAPRCLSCGNVLIVGEKQCCKICAGHFAIYGNKKKEVTA